MTATDDSLENPQLWKLGVTIEDVIRPTSQDPSELIETGLKNITNVMDTNEVNWAYYHGTKQIDQIGIATPPELRLIQVAIDWPAVVVEGLENRLDPTGIIIPGMDEEAARLWDTWHVNDMVLESQMHRIDTLVTGTGYIAVGTNEDDPDNPLITVEDSSRVFVYRSPRTGKYEWGIRIVEAEQSTPTAVMLYLLDKTSLYVRSQSTGKWTEVPDSVDEHGLGEIPITPNLNRGRKRDQWGRSEMDRIKSIADDCTRTLTEMALAREFHAVPQRYLLGVDKDDFVDPKTGKPIPQWKAYIGYYLMLNSEDANVGQFQTSDLRNFHETINMYAKLASSSTGYPVAYFGFAASNPASADAIRADENRLIKQAERQQTPLSSAYKRTLQLVWRIRNNGKELPPEMKQLSIAWADPATPTMASKADATTKLVQTGIIDNEMAWDMLGFTEEQKDALRGRMSIRADLGRMLQGGQDSGSETVDDSAQPGDEPAVETDGEPVPEDATE